MCDSVRSEYQPRIDKETVSPSAGRVAGFMFMKVS